MSDTGGEPVAPARTSVSRRRVLSVSGTVVGLGALGAVGWDRAPVGFTERIRRGLGLAADPFVPSAAEGEVRVERLRSRAMGDIDVFTAVPAGFGDGAGLPVVVVLHGASASAAALRGFGLARFVSAAVAAGAPPFVLAGTDDGPAGWLPAGGVDPQLMLREELPRWLGQRGFAAERRALWGWSRGGYGALRFVVSEPASVSAVALFSPALHSGDPVLTSPDLGALGDLPWGLWCGESDPFRDGSVALADAAPVPPDPWVSGEGGHTRTYWNEHTLDMLAWVAQHL